MKQLSDHNTHTTRQAILALLRAALTNTVSPLPASLHWDDIMEVANEQGVLAMVYDGYCAYAKESAVEISLKDKANLYGNVKKIELAYDRQKRVVERLARLYGEHGIRMMVLKGYGLSTLYPVPNHRQCSDVDIFLYGRYDDGDALVEQEWKIPVSREHHHHTRFVVDGILVENHFDFVNVHAHASGASMERELKSLVEREDGEEILIDGVVVYGMPPTLGALFLLRHTAQHFAARHIELRHLIDWLLFARKNYAKIDWGIVDRVAQEMGLKSFLEALDNLAKSLVEDVELSDIEQRIMLDIWAPKYKDCDDIEIGIKSWYYKALRWWGNRWKNRLVYKESLLNQAWTLVTSRFIKPL
ncbi:MAG: nucleotidyltransferase family protein [Bacteroidia bacterium]|nr:nucleotidyltransferase family protein [Bacteroidia bacterium]